MVIPFDRKRSLISQSPKRRRDLNQWTVEYAMLVKLYGPEPGGQTRYSAPKCCLASYVPPLSPTSPTRSPSRCGLVAPSASPTLTRSWRTSWPTAEVRCSDAFHYGYAAVRDFLRDAVAAVLGKLKAGDMAGAVARPEKAIAHYDA
jgi:hypothetical protein